MSHPWLRRVLTGVVLAIALALVPACGDDGADAPSGTTSDITSGTTSDITSDITSDEPEFTEPGTVFEVSVGDEVTIVLESNATTGYAWALEREVLADVVVLVDDEYVAPETDLVGAGGRQELTFAAVGEGTAEIALWYVRSFDDPKEPAQRAVFEVVVDG